MRSDPFDLSAYDLPSAPAMPIELPRSRARVRARRRFTAPAGPPACVAAPREVALTRHAAPAPVPIARASEPRDDRGGRRARAHVEAHWGAAWLLAGILCLAPLVAYSIAMHDGRRDSGSVSTYAASFRAEGRR